jgi:hypothetical protein
MGRELLLRELLRPDSVADRVFAAEDCLVIPAREELVRENRRLQIRDLRALA